MGTLDYKDIIDVLKAVNEINRVHGHIAKAPIDEAATLEAAGIERPSTSTTPTERGRGHGQRVASTPRVVLSPNPSPPTRHHSTHPISMSCPHFSNLLRGLIDLWN